MQGCHKPSICKKIMQYVSAKCKKGMCNKMRYTSVLVTLASKVSEEKAANYLIEDALYMMIYFSLAAFKILSLSLSFESLIIMCLSVGLCEFILPGVYLDSWIFILIFFIKFGIFLAIISSNILSTPFFLLLWDSHDMYVGFFDGVP